MKSLVAVVAALVVALVWAVWAAWPGEHEPLKLAARPPAVVPPVSPAPSMPAAAPAPAEIASTAQAAAPAVAASAPVPAALSMSQAREQGDERMPPVAPPDPAESALQPTPLDLSDPARYQAHEQRQNQRVREQFLRAADSQLPVWRAALAQARAQGASPEDVAAGEEKIRRLEAVQERLRNAGSGP